ncbi:uncharacterized protein LOC132902430 [Amyelois transitella]|uniref:uncharacterized protein LOC132902430 n=1 Tax=Amyelois transitella TaxID=680683 RepID=UPI00298F930C|nr:uncharacterized protein LOC132902430 [Amyelois transitella]XP_060803395.1 uncharacterized protein LOC132902430 [Amyelois transitella]
MSNLQFLYFMNRNKAGNEDGEAPNSLGLNISDIDKQESLEDTSDTKLIIEKENEEQEEIVITGNRIIDFAYIFQQLQQISNHSTAFGCNLNCLKLKKEVKKGFRSIFHFKCQMCNESFKLKNCPDSDNNMDLDLNDNVVSSFMSIGAGFSGLELVSASLNIPCMSDKLYAKCHTKVCELWELAKEKSMADAAKEEYDLAIINGEVDSNGIPMITVVADACWSKRSYRKNFNALSGAAVIIGYKTKKVLYMAVKNKYCMVCARAENKKEATPEHICFKNYTGSSSGMEATALVEGFKTSVETHKLIYSRLIADGDSSTHSNILRAKPYGNLLVEKIECTNHLLRNYCTKLDELTRNTNYPIKYRRAVQNNILRLRRCVNGAVKHIGAKNITFEEKVLELKNDLLNAPHHVFGNHASCKPYYCKKLIEDEAPEENVVLAMKSKDGGFIFSAITKILSRLVNNAKSLIHCVNSNIAEVFNSIIAKFIGGKRINYSGRQSYSGRCAASVVSFNSKQPQTYINKNIFLRSPNKLIKRLEMQRNLKRMSSVKRIIFKCRKSNQNRKKSNNRNNDENYGEACQKPDLSEADFDFAKTEHLKTMTLSEEDRQALERRTILQAESMEWRQERKLRLTASVFGKVCKRGLIKCGPLVKNLVTEKNLEHVKSISYGQSHEALAREQLECHLKKPIRSCGLFIDQNLPFLGASPDGLVEDDKIVEIKCPYAARDLSVDDAIKTKKILFWKISKDGNTVLNKRHDWFFQAQGQIHIAQRKTCIFAVWTNVDMKIEMIEEDLLFWNDMEEKLIKFYFSCLLPELIDSRLDRQMEIKEPKHILEAIENRNTKEVKRKLDETTRETKRKRKK